MFSFELMVHTYVYRTLKKEKKKKKRVEEQKIDSRRYKMSRFISLNDHSPM